MYCCQGVLLVSWKSASRRYLGQNDGCLSRNTSKHIRSTAHFHHHPLTEDILAVMLWLARFLSRTQSAPCGVPFCNMRI